MECKINTIVYLDHNMLHVTMYNLNQDAQGRGFWKLNTALQKDHIYVPMINVQNKEAKKQCQGLNDKGLFVDVLKMDIVKLLVMQVIRLHKAFGETIGR